jgi:hypothetical protein
VNGVNYAYVTVGDLGETLVYVARSSPAAPRTWAVRAWACASRTGPSRCRVRPEPATPRSGPFRGIDEVIVDVRGLPANQRFAVYLIRGRETTALLSATSTTMGDIPESVAFLDFFANHYDKVIVRPGTPSSWVSAGAGLVTASGDQFRGEAG